jgi:hypothetical protein
MAGVWRTYWKMVLISRLRFWFSHIMEENLELVMVSNLHAIYVLAWNPQLSYSQWLARVQAFRGPRSFTA